MAFILPVRAGAGSVGTGGRTRKARLPTAADVPTQEVARDPGVQVPNIAQFQTGLQDVGAAIGEVGADIAARRKAEEARLAAAEERITKRQEAVERIRDVTGFTDSAGKLLTEATSAGDLSREEDLDAFGARLNQMVTEALENHRGGPESKLQLQAQLLPVLQRFSDKGGNAAVKAQDALASAEGQSIINETVAQFSGGNQSPYAAIAQGFARLDANGDAFRAEDRTVLGEQLETAVWNAQIDRFMRVQDFASAEATLNNVDAQRALGPGAQKTAFDRIAKAKFDVLNGPVILNDQQMVDLGFPPELIAGGLVVEQDRNGWTVLLKPTTDETQRDQKIADFEKQLVDNGMEAKEAHNQAVNFVDGNIRIEIVPETGVARLINDITKEVKEVPLGTIGPAPVPPPQGQTIWELNQTGAIAGVVPAIQDVIARTLGQFSPVFTDEDVVQARQVVEAAQSEMLRALALNRRFPAAEITRIQKEIEIAPAAFDSTSALAARLRGIDEVQRTRLAQREAFAVNPNMPQEARSDAAQEAEAIRNFLTRLGVPPAGIADDPIPEDVPEFSTKIGVTKGGAEVWQSPDGRKWAVEPDSQEQSQSEGPGKISFNLTELDLPTLNLPQGVRAVSLNELRRLNRNKSKLVEVPPAAAAKLDDQLLKRLNDLDDKTLHEVFLGMTELDRERAGEEVPERGAIPRDRLINFIFKNTAYVSAAKGA